MTLQNPTVLFAGRRDRAPERIAATKPDGGLALRRLGGEIYMNHISELSEHRVRTAKRQTVRAVWRCHGGSDVIPCRCSVDVLRRPFSQAGWTEHPQRARDRGWRWHGGTAVIPCQWRHGLNGRNLPARPTEPKEQEPGDEISSLGARVAACRRSPGCLGRPQHLPIRRPRPRYTVAWPHPSSRAEWLTISEHARATR